MRKLTVLAAAAMLPLFGTGAWAAISGTAHASGATGATSGDCSICHIPHAAQGNRLWPEPPAAVADTGDKISSFCGYCHLSTGGNALPSAYANNSVWSTAAHGYGTTTNPDGNASNTSTLAYSTTTGTIQCTTCHDVHNDTQRPFLRVDQDTMCQLCHPNRGNAAANWAGYGNANATGSHPVGPNVYNDTIVAPHTAVDSPLEYTPLGIRTYGTVADYRLGPKLTNGAAAPAAGAGIVCNSCHAVHGVETGDSGVMAANTPNEDLLAVFQTNANGHANGNGSPRNALCEACHDDGGAATVNGAGVSYAGSYRPNPGATTNTHPVDDLASELNWVTTFPAGWPQGTQVTAALGNAAICESCHMPHPAASATAQPSPATPATVANNTPILRDATAQVCNRCHSASIAGHHPVGAMPARYVDDAISGVDGNTADLTCVDCHGGNNAGAHNWGATGIAINNVWEPTNNARTTADQAAAGSANQINANMSKECVDCHVGVGAAGNNRAPTQNGVATGATVTVTSGSTEYQDNGDGTHWIGANGGAGNGVTYASGFIAAAFNATTTAWPVGNGAFSRWGSASGNVVCESCHELEPARNVASTALLLHWYTEGGATGTTTALASSSGTTIANTAADTQGEANATSQFCTGCHGQAPGGGTPHPMTGGTITKVVDSGLGYDQAARTTTTLKTSNGGFAVYAGSYMNATATAISNAQVTLPAVDAMNCDSCHQTHDTPSNSGAWIIDTAAANITGGLGAAPWGASPTSANYQAFCIECHSY